MRTLGAILATIALLGAIVSIILGVYASVELPGQYKFIGLLFIWPVYAGFKEAHYVWTDSRRF